MVKMSSQVGSLGKALTALDGKFGGIGQDITNLIKNFTIGGIWEVAAYGIRMIIDLIGKHREEAEKTAEAERKAFEDRAKAIDAYREQIEKCYAASVSAIDANLKKINEEIDAMG